MLDFLLYDVEKKYDKKTGELVYYISPDFKVRRCSDLMIRGKDFYAIWDDSQKLWVTKEDVALSLIDNDIRAYAEKVKEEHPDAKVVPIYTYNSKRGVIDLWHRYVQKQLRDNYHQLDEEIIFSDKETTKTDYASKKLSYPLVPCPTPAYDEIISTLYSPEERKKIEWAIGSIVTGDSRTVQKFAVLYGEAGSGKSTILHIIEQLFDGYCTNFDAKALGSANSPFALEAFQGNPLVAIQHDGDLSRIEDNTRLNSIVSHEMMRVNEKFKSTYDAKFNCFLFVGTNKPVKITDAKSGLVRRLIDISPTGEKLPIKKYRKLMGQIKYELGGIACHCRDVYLADPDAYENYIPVSMLGATNDMYNFVEENYFDFKQMDEVTLNEAYIRYNQYCLAAKVTYPLTRRAFKEELKNYFKEFRERKRTADGTQKWNVYSGFKADKFIFAAEDTEEKKPEEESVQTWLNFKEGLISEFDKMAADYPAQYAKTDGTPTKRWDSVGTKLHDISTNKLHYVKVPENHIVIDFDIKNEKGEKDYQKNLEAASKWPQTYAELSKSGAGIHLHYIYSGDPSKLSRVYDDEIEVKVFSGNSSLRRMLTKCNDIPIATINSGLPLKGDSKVLNWDGIKSEKQLRTMIIKNLNKEYHSATKPSVDYIYDLLEQAYEAKVPYDVTDLKPQILAFASQSTNQAKYCIKRYKEMKFKSENESEQNYISEEDEPFVFFDVEVFPNLFLVNWKKDGAETCMRMINPTSTEIEDFLRQPYKLVGFNCRRYDNHILYGRMMGKTNEQLYKMSQRIINKKNTDAFIREAYNLSYTDIYDFASKKQSLKKWEIELGIHHKELGLPWDQPVPEEQWSEVAEYCDNDVIATEAVFHELVGDFESRLMLVELANVFAPNTKSCPNDTTNMLTGRIIFGDNKKPQDEFVYTDLSRYFKGYKFESGKSTYRGETVGEGGYVYAEPGMYGKVVTFDVASMHPHSAIAMDIFGPRYTKQFKNLVDFRIAVKHKNFDTARQMFDGALSGYLNDEKQAKKVAGALKIAINSVYGLTAASFDNLFRDPRNVDNIVAKRGALFMIDLKHAVQDMGGTVVHIKTDSIKVLNPTEAISKFIFEYGKQWGYTFEIESEYEKICLVNDAVYIAKCTDDPVNEDKAGKWTATGAQFAHPYIFKTLFSKEKIEFEDMCETKATTTALYLDMNENLPDVTVLEKELEKQTKKGADESVLEDLRKRIAEGHNYIFIGKVGQFCPVVAGAGGGYLLREQNGKYNSVSGAKGFRWLESERVKLMHEENCIDKDYFRNLVDTAIVDISQYGDFEWFSSDESSFSYMITDPLPKFQR